MIWTRIIITLLLFAVSQGEDCSCFPAKTGLSETLRCECKKNWQDAQQHCVDWGGQLATIGDENIQGSLVRLLKQGTSGGFDAWIGGKSTTTSWHWTKSKLDFKEQGCYSYDPTETANWKRVTINGMTQQGCIMVCKSLRRKVAILKTGASCYCGDSFGRAGAGTDCNMPCTGFPMESCGGFSSYLAFLVNGEYSEPWENGEPALSPLGEDGECLSLDCVEGNWLWKPKPCGKKQSYFCEFRSNGTCSDDTIQVKNKCVRIMNWETQNWFDARQKCRDDGGNLLEIDTDHVETTITRDLECWQRSFWLGGTKVSWKWTSGQEMQYTKWAIDQPNGSNKQCLAMSYGLSDEYEWANVDCDMVKMFLCQKAIRTTTISTTPTTTESTTVLTTTTTTPTTTPTTTLDYNINPDPHAHPHWPQSSSTDGSQQTTVAAFPPYQPKTPFPADQDQSSPRPDDKSSPKSRENDDKHSYKSRENDDQSTTKSPQNGEGVSNMGGNTGASESQEAVGLKTEEKIILGVCVGAFALLCLICIIIYCCRCQSRRSKGSKATANGQRKSSDGKSAFLKDNDFAFVKPDSTGTGTKSIQKTEVSDNLANSNKVLNGPKIGKTNPADVYETEPYKVGYETEGDLHSVDPSKADAPKSNGVFYIAGSANEPTYKDGEPPQYDLENNGEVLEAKQVGYIGDIDSAVYVDPRIAADESSSDCSEDIVIEISRF